MEYVVEKPTKLLLLLSTFVFSANLSKIWFSVAVAKKQHKTVILSLILAKTTANATATAGFFDLLLSCCC